MSSTRIAANGVDHCRSRRARGSRSLGEQVAGHAPHRWPGGAQMSTRPQLDQPERRQDAAGPSQATPAFRRCQPSLQGPVFCPAFRKASCCTSVVGTEGTGRSPLPFQEAPAGRPAGEGRACLVQLKCPPSPAAAPRTRSLLEDAVCSRAPWASGFPDILQSEEKNWGFRVQGSPTAETGKLDPRWGALLPHLRPGPADTDGLHGSCCRSRVPVSSHRGRCGHGRWRPEPRPLPTCPKGRRRASVSLMGGP